ncbi:MAG: AbrB/MazE/SpoVT family DNA-binding domain-containing protein [Oscillospiraceae bacterium]|nr:AbrB/MazE/SpoVT family DNA-binding domain-containing protein [Oscillospiraceae bacterium]
MLTTIQKWGNSQGVRLPKTVLDVLLLQENDHVEVLTENDAIVIRKAARRRRAKKSLEERLEEFYQKPIAEILEDDTLYNPTEYDWGKPVGREVW